MQHRIDGKATARESATSSRIENVPAFGGTQQFPPSRCSFQMHQPQESVLINKFAPQQQHHHQHQSSRTRHDIRALCGLHANHHNLTSRQAQCRHHQNDCLLPRRNHHSRNHASNERPLRIAGWPNLLFLVLCAAALGGGGGTTRAVAAEEMHLYDDVREDSHTYEQHQRQQTSLGDDLHYDQPINCPYHHGANSHKSQQQQQQQQQQHHHHQHHHYNQVQSGSSSSSSGSTSDHYQMLAATAALEEPPSHWPPSQAAKGGRHRTTGGEGQEVVEGAAKAPACEDCLAIPLVALVGDKQINGFIIPSSSSSGRNLQGTASYRANPHERAKQQQHEDDTFSYEQPPIQRHPQQQQQARGYNNYDSYSYKYETPVKPTAAPSLEPKSDEKCPMTAPLTVCDHIGSYPTDVILNKLDSAKKQLGKSHFNLDSFFSDERDNSNDPFEIPPKMKKVPHHQHNDVNGNNVTTMTRKHGNSSSSYGYPAAADPSANIYTHLAANPESGGQHERRRTRADKGEYNAAAADRGASPAIKGSKPGGAWQEQRVMIHPEGQSSNDRWGTSSEDSTPSMQDDFVDLVERQAISLAPADRRVEPRPRGSLGAYRQPEPTGSRQPDRLSSPKYHYQQKQQGERIGHPHQGSILTFNRTATGSGGRYQSTTTKTGTKTSGAFGRQSSAPLKLMPSSARDTVATNYDDEKHQQASADPESPATGSAPPETGADDQTYLESKVYSSERASATATSASPSQNRHPSASLAAGKQQRRGSRQERQRQEQQQSQTANEMAPGTGGSANRRKTRRSRRQVTSVLVTASSGSGPMAAARRNPAMTSRGDGNASDPSDSGRDGTDSDNSSSPPPSETSEPPSESSNESQAEPVCRAKSIYISPRAALNDKKQWKYVVNAPERNPQIRQIIRVDICQDPFGPCSDQVSIPFGFTSECKQKYSKKKLLALDAKSGLLEVDTFFIPSCCVCQLIRSNSNQIDEDNSSPLQQPPAAEIDTPNLPPSPATTPSSSSSALSTPADESNDGASR